MSLSFYLPHKKTLFSNKILKVREILELLPKLQQFTYDTKEEGFDKEKLLESKLNEHTCLLLGYDLVSARGFEVSFEKDLNNKDAYRVRFFTPSPEDDWKVGLAFLEALAEKLGVSITSEYGDTYTAETVGSFDFDHDINFGISSMFSPSEDPETGEMKEFNADTMTLFGLYRPVVFNRELKEKIMASENPVKEFSDFFTDIQYLESFSANQRFYQDKADDSILCLYVITQSVDVILPYEPFVEFKNMHIAKTQDVKSWKLSITVIEGDERDPGSYKTLAVVDYKEFMKKLPKEKYHFIDAAYVEIQGLTRAELDEMVQKVGEA